MSNSQNNLRQTIDWVRLAFPPHALIHVGAGRGAGEMHQWREWDVSRALLVDPLVKPDGGFEDVLREHSGWQWISSALAAEDDEADFYVASNPNESGLLDIERLLPLWPDLRMLEWSRVVTRRLDSLLLAQDEPLSPDWLIVDCLPALPVLKGAGEFLNGIQVVWARIVFDDALTHLREASLAGLTEFLLLKSYRCVFQGSCSNSKVGEAIFVKDWLRLFRTEHDWNTASSNVAVTHQQQQISLERDELRRENLRLAAEVEKLSTANDRLEVIREELTSEKSQLEHTCERLTRKRADLIVTRDALARKKIELLEVCDQRASEIERLSSSYESLKQEYDKQAQALNFLEQEKSELLKQQEILQSERGHIRDEREYLLREKTELADRQRHLEDQLSRQATQTAIVDQHAVSKLGFDTEIESLTNEIATLSEQRDVIVDENARLKTELKNLTQQRDALADSLESARISFNAEREELLQSQRLHGQGQSQAIDKPGELEKAFALYQSQLDTLTQENRELAGQLEMQDRLNAELRIKCYTLTGQKAGSGTNNPLLEERKPENGGSAHGSTELVAEQQRLLDEAERENEALATQRLNLALEMSNLAARLADREAILQEREHRLESLESELSEYNRRQYLMNQEMLKAEAQIDLIKDVLLRDSMT